MENNSEISTVPKKNKNRPRIIISIVVLIAILVIGSKVWYAFTHEETDNAQVEMRLVPILARASGYVDKIYLDDYVSVKKGQLMLEIDSTELLMQLDEMKADYNQSLADIENAKASITNAEASLSYSKGNEGVIALRKEKAMNDFNRDKNLFEANAITEKQFDDSRSNFDINMKQFETGGWDVHVAETRLNMLHSLLSRSIAQAQLKKARIDQQLLKISYCRVFATSDGNIGKRNVDIGQFIQAGAPLFTIINTQSIWIDANFKENQIRDIHIGSIANIKVDGFPKIPITGKVIAFSDATGARFSLLPPDNTTGNFVKVTQRIPVRIEINDIEKYKDILKAGMSVEVSIPTN
jgi:membrane fusion protein (multidrug efflux system)